MYLFLGVYFLYVSMTDNSRLSTSVSHWEDALDRVASAASAIRNGNDCQDEGSEDKKERNPEHDASDQIEDLLVSLHGIKGDINVFAIFFIILIDENFSSKFGGISILGVSAGE